MAARRSWCDGPCHDSRHSVCTRWTVSLWATTRVIQSHILAMYPVIFSGVLISRFGAHKIIKAGLVVMLACIGAGLNNPQFFHYLVALILGVGWNFLFLGSTTLLTQAVIRQSDSKCRQ